MIPIPPLEPIDPRPWHHRAVAAARHPVAWLTDLTGNGPVYALLILFGLNMVDEMDRTAFGLLLPNIRDHFGMSDAGILSLVAVASLLGLSLQVPIAQLADRRSRVRLMLVGAAVFAAFSVGTGLAVSVWMLRSCGPAPGVGFATVGPTHNSLISDYYPIATRPRVFSVHRAANAVGAFVGPLTAGLLAVVARAGGRRSSCSPCRWPCWWCSGCACASRCAASHEREAMGRHRRPSLHRGGAAVVRRGLAHGLEDREPAAHLLRAAVPGRRAHRLLVAGRPALRAALRPRRGAAGLGGRGGRARAAGRAGRSAPRVGTKLMARDPGLVLRFLALVAFITSLLAAVFALVPGALGGASSPTWPSRPRWPSSARACSPRWPWPSRPGRAPWASPMGAIWVIPGLIVLPIVGAICDSIGIQAGHARDDPGVPGRRPGHLDRGPGHRPRHQAGVDHRRGTLGGALRAPPGPGQAPAGARPAGRLRQRAGPLRRGPRDRRGRDHRACWAPTAPGSRPCSRPSAGWSRPTRARSSSTAATSPTPRPTRSPRWGSPACPAGQGVFPSLTVAENLRVAGWLERRDPAHLRARTAHVLELFPVLRRADGASRPPTSRAASSRCWRWAWPSWPAPGCC